jgi:hypothetical protein
MKRWLTITALLLAGCGKPIYETSPGTTASGSTGNTGSSQDQELHIAATRRAPNVMFVVDRSGSMTDAASVGSTGSKWQAVLSLMTGANAFPAQLQTALTNATGESAQLGLVTFGSDEGTCGPGTLNVAPAPGTGTQISSALGAIAPSGGTPTAAALQLAQQALATAPDSAGRSAYIVLLTDGAPNCNPNWQGDPGACIDDGTGYGGCASSQACFTAEGLAESSATPTGCLDDDNTVGVVQHLRDDSGIRTLVIGFGDAVGTPGSRAYQAIDRMAEAGGMSLSAQAGTHFVRAASEDDLASAFDAIRTDLPQHCSFELAQAAPVAFTAVNLAAGAQTSSLALGSFLLSTDRLRVQLSDDACARVAARQVEFVFKTQ